MNLFLQSLVQRAAGLPMAGDRVSLQPRPRSRFEPVSGETTGGVDARSMEQSAEVLAPPAQVRGFTSPEVSPVERGRTGSQSRAVARSHSERQEAASTIWHAGVERRALEARSSPALPRAGEQETRPGLDVGSPPTDYPPTVKRPASARSSAQARSDPGSLAESDPLETYPIHMGEAPRERDDVPLAEGASTPAEEHENLEPGGSVPSPRTPEVLESKPDAVMPAPSVEVDECAAGADEDEVSVASGISVSIGRIEVNVVDPPRPAVMQPSRRQTQRTSGFAGYDRARRGRLR